MSRDNIFKLDKRFIKKLRDRLLQLHNQFLSSADSKLIPSTDQIEEIILDLFFASIQHEEGRLSRFRVVFREPLLLDDLALVFQNPKPWNVEELRKLAPAILPPDGHLGVWYSEEQGLYIWGLQTLGLDHVAFEVLDPGRVIVTSLSDFKVAEFKSSVAGFISDDWNNKGFNLMSAQVDYAVNQTNPALRFFPIIGNTRDLTTNAFTEAWWNYYTFAQKSSDVEKRGG